MKVQTLRFRGAKVRVYHRCVLGYEYWVAEIDLETGWWELPEVFYSKRALKRGMWYWTSRWYTRLA